jgi:hypothetical protein
MLRARNGSAGGKLLGVRESLSVDRWQTRRGVDDGAQSASAAMHAS